MSINRSDELPKRTCRLEPVDAHHQEDESDPQRKKKKVSYQGRTWSEREEDLPLQPSLPAMEKGEKHEKAGAFAVYADLALLEKAEKLLSRYVSLEEKIAQLLYYQTEAFYDVEAQRFIELVVQQWQIGGLLFTKGEYRRQSYLIERYQSLSSTPLLIGNDFLHGLSFYFQDSPPAHTSFETMDEGRYSDLGKAVVFQNRRLGVHFQFDRERAHEEGQGPFMSELQACAFRNGIREAKGVVGREKMKRKIASYSFSSKKSQVEIATQFAPDQVQEAFGLRAINFLNLADLGKENLRQNMIEAFQSHYDAFLVKGEIDEIIHMLSNAVVRGDLKESDLDRRLIKILLIKMIFFQMD